MRSRNTRLTGIMAAVAVGALVVGCSDAGSSDADGSTRTGSASASSAASSASSSTGVSPAEAQGIQTKYDAANNVAIKRATTAPYDEKAWRSVDSGPVLAIDAYHTRLERYRKNAKATTMKVSVDSAWGDTSKSSDG